MSRDFNLAIVGCGGIAWHLAEEAARIIRDTSAMMYLIDGDEIEERNLERQFYPGVVGKNKAEAMASSIRFPVTVIPVSDFVNRRTVVRHRSEWLQPKTVVIAAVDNNPSRVLLEEEIMGFEDGVLISGGNDEHTGQAQVYIRADGEEVTWPITEISPEILHDKEEMPDTFHCLANAVSDPQTALVNRMVAMACLLFLNKAVGIIKEFGWPMLATEWKWPNEIRVDTNGLSMSPRLATPVPTSNIEAELISARVSELMGILESRFVNRDTENPGLAALGGPVRERSKRRR